MHTAPAPFRGDASPEGPLEASPEGPLEASPETLASAVAARLPAQGPLGVAFSGGVDSAVVLAVAARTLGTGAVVALLGVSASLAASERTIARDVAANLGVRLVEVATRELDDPAYRRNEADRCFHCKNELFTRIDDGVAADLGLRTIAYGHNADDALRPDRPGAAAAVSHGVIAPLAQAGLGKADVRRLARHLGLSVADKPAAPCLASRIPHRTEVTPERLRQVERAEEAVRALGLGDVRVRHHGDVARVELAPSGLERAVAPGVREALVAGVRAAGFRYVTLDLAGLTSGAFTLDLLASRG